MPEREREDATILMNAAAGGDKAAADRLLPLVYDQLRGAAEARLAGERNGHTLSATAMVHEAYLRLVGPRHVPWAGRGHFYAAAAEAMRQILMDHARANGRVKRGGGRPRVELSSVQDLIEAGSSEMLTFDEAFRRLEDESPECAAGVRLRFYAGLTAEQTAKALAISLSTVGRRWSFAQAWLFRELDGSKEA